MVLTTPSRKRQRQSRANNSRPDPIETVEDFDLTENGHTTDSSQPDDDLQRGATNPASSTQSCWTHRYADVHCQPGLAVSTKKFNEIVEWLRLALEHLAPRFLVLSGPPGCGKASALNAACEKLRCSVVSWDAPLTGSTGISATLVEDFHSFVVGTRYGSLVSTSVHEQRNGGSQSPSTQSGSAKQNSVLVIDDLPLHIADLRDHRESVQRLFWNIARFAPYPAVLLLSDNDKGVHRLSHMILGSSLLSSEWVASISIPPVTAAMMRKRLQQVLASECVSVSRDLLDIIVSSSNGDIRSALNSLQLSVISAERTERSKQAELSRRRRKRPRATKEKNGSLCMELDRDTTLSTYHAVSKILNNKRGESGASRYVAEQILDEARIDPSVFIAFLHHNYPDFFGNSDDVVPTLTCLSEADTLLPWRQEDDFRLDLRECAASIVTRGFLYFNTQPNRYGWRPIHGPESHKIWKASRNHVQYSNKLFTSRRQPHLSTRSELCETLPYANKIMALSAPKCFPFASNAATSQEIVCNEARRENTHGRNSNLESTGNKTIRDDGEGEEDLTDPIEEWDDDGW
ncbi:Checkpoint protein Rad17/Rad24 [Gracilaria domingensis]|nr:Checkpoint protein Rad17/Rad24 [Gracilaria domingensis]